MTAGQAVRILKQKPPGTFFLRSKPDGFWLSFKKLDDNRITHSRIDCDHQSVDGVDVTYYSVAELSGERFTSIRRLVEALTARGVMTSAINRRLPSATATLSSERSSVAELDRVESPELDRVESPEPSIPTLGGHEANRLLRDKPQKVLSFLIVTRPCIQ